MKGRLGWGVCGSFCTVSAACNQIAHLSSDWEVVPVLSDNVRTIDTRFGSAAEVRARIEGIAGRRAVDSIVDAEPLGPKEPLDVMVIAPCTGNTLAKLAHGITDTPVTMAAKAHLRADRPLLLALATNDGLSANLANISILLERKSVFFVPFAQDDPVRKPHSLICRFEKLPEALEEALQGRQLQPVLAAEMKMGS